MKKEKSNIGIYVTGTEPKAIESYGELILKIITTLNANDETKQEALKALNSNFTQPISLSNVNVDMGKEWTYDRIKR